MLGCSSSDVNALLNVSAAEGFLSLRGTDTDLPRSRELRGGAGLLGGGVIGVWSGVAAWLERRWCRFRCLSSQAGQQPLPSNIAWPQEQVVPAMSASVSWL